MNFDLRTLERHLRQNPELRKEYEKYLKELPNETDNAEEVKVYEEEAAQMTFSEIQES